MNEREANLQNMTDLSLFQNLEIVPYDSSTRLNERSDLMKLELTPMQKSKIGSLVQYIPSVISAGTLSHAYIVKFPKGMPHTLMQYKTDGFGSSVMGENGIIDHASFHPIRTQAMMLGAFTAMSVATGQYFLTQIHNELNMMKQNLDKILEFLYGDKKAELLSEISFIKYAYQNYNSIMEYEQQRIATIISLQEAKKIAMKDIEFYMNDLCSTVTSDSRSDIIVIVDKAFQIKESLDLSIQLYGMANLLEVYYSQNYDIDYVKNIEKDISTYIAKCEKRMLSTFSALNALVVTFKEKPWEKIDRETIEKRVDEVIESLNDGEDSELCKSFCSALKSCTKDEEYYIDRKGDVYIKQFKNS